MNVLLRSAAGETSLSLSLIAAAVRNLKPGLRELTGAGAALDALDAGVRAVVRVSSCRVRGHSRRA